MNRQAEERSSEYEPPGDEQRTSFRGRGARGRGRGQPRRNATQVFSKSGGRNRPGKGGPEPKSDRVDGTIKPTPPTIPKPQHLSKTASPLSNDPLWMEAFAIDGFRGFAEEGRENTFTVTADSFIALVRRTYENVCTADKEFSRHVSYSMYQYYNTIHFWGRVAMIRSHSGRTTEDERNLISYLSSREYPIHEPISAFLRALGDFEDPSGSEHYFRLMSLPNAQEIDDIAGFFGRVGPDTHYLYESLPSPGVVALRVIKDLEYTRGEGPKDWNLPDEIQPLEMAPPVEEEEWEEEQGQAQDEAIPEEERRAAERAERPRNLPTANLLGWGPAVKLTTEQRQTLENCGVEDGFATNLTRFTINEGLHDVVADRVRRSTDRYKGGASLHDHRTGSLVQCAYSEKEPGPQPFSRNQLYCEGAFRGSCAYQLGTRLSVAAVVMGLRMPKEACGDTHNWACYDFNRYRDVPEDWIVTRNRVFEFGNVAVINHGTKHTAYTSKNRLRTPLQLVGSGWDW